MKFQLIRNATLKINYAGKVFLVDPMLCPKDSFSPFAPGLKKNPIIDLVLPVEDILKDIEAVLVTHSHPDHFDAIAVQRIPKNVPLFCTPADEEFIIKQGFNNSTVVDDSLTWEGITFTRIEGQHGSGPVLSFMGEVSAYILQAKNEPTIFIISDSILTDSIIKGIEKYAPDVIIVNSGGGIIPGFENYPVHMNEEQTIKVLQLAPDAMVIAVHMEAIDFCKTTRDSLRIYANQNNVNDDKLLIPKDGQKFVFQFKK